MSAGVLTNREAEAILLSLVEDGLVMAEVPCTQAKGFCCIQG